MGPFSKRVPFNNLEEFLDTKRMKKEQECLNATGGPEGSGRNCFWNYFSYIRRAQKAFSNDPSTSIAKECTER